MLTPELVRARVKGNELELRPLKPKDRARAEELAEQLLAVTRACVGRTRQELELAWEEVPSEARERQLMMALHKLIEDSCEFSADPDTNPVALRQEVFLQAARVRLALLPGEVFDRERVLAQIAETRSATPEQLDRGLYSDLRGAHQLLRAPKSSGKALVREYESAQAQAVLLRAVKVLVSVRASSAHEYRDLFRKLKFRRLLYTLKPVDDGYVIEIDGPFSMFESVTKYGLQLALLVPVLEQCARYDLVAEVRWGAARRPLVYRLSGGGGAAAASDGAALPDELATFVKGFEALGSDWDVLPATAILDLPGAGLTVPDLLFRQHGTGAEVYFELLGFWSRDAVWRKVELVERGLGAPVLFAVSSRLRVSEAVLDEDAASALYVFKGVISPRAVLQRLTALANRSSGAGKRRTRRDKPRGSALG